MENNPYQAPSASVAEHTEEVLAGRGERFLAALIDTILLCVILVPAMFATGYFEQAARGEVGIGKVVAYGFAGFLVFLIVQGWPLAQSAQTWGKKVLGIRIALLDGTQPTFGTLILKRYLPVQVAGAIPVLGLVLSMINVLLIFRSDRRCGHDLIAGTQVLKN
ncbi:RDD family protein [Noviluteimonas gilva]|uniref:RDD family protein n=1 Tax=Noviluteimonas gilva TaxID=2682097 RepID=A0A7C9HZU2_9GAMM|nr:RDD family protein [Lysobacter gilvus]MUV15074.1 RDD family protein [Lysobacter gilvus]